MSQYYYLVASLPVLSYDDPHAEEPETFLGTAADHLSESDFAVVASASIDAPVELEREGSVVSMWQHFERGLRNELVKTRSARLGSDGSEFLRVGDSGSDDGDRPGLTETARTALSEHSPLAGEHLLSRARWAYLEDLESGHFFDVERIAIHYLKLQILARKRLFNREDGERVFAASTDKIMNDYYQEQGDV